MTISAVSKEKIKSLLRQQSEYDPEPVIKQLEMGDFMPACKLFEKIMVDQINRAAIIQNYVGNITELFGKLSEETRK